MKQLVKIFQMLLLALMLWLPLRGHIKIHQTRYASHRAFEDSAFMAILLIISNVDIKPQKAQTPAKSSSERTAQPESAHVHTVTHSFHWLLVNFAAKTPKGEN